GALGPNVLRFGQALKRSEDILLNELTSTINYAVRKRGILGTNNNGHRSRQCCDTVRIVSGNGVKHRLPNLFTNDIWSDRVTVDRLVNDDLNHVFREEHGCEISVHALALINR